jgi:hypothetical protein
MFAFFNSFDWQHSVLLGGAIIGGVLVGIGILMESEKWSLAAILVLIGIAMEPIFTIGLFVYDESLSRTQQSTIEAQNREIISLQKRLAPRHVSPEIISSKIKQFAGQQYAVSASSVEESFLMELDKALTDGGWVLVTPFGLFKTLGGSASVNLSFGLKIGYAPSRQSDMGVVAKVLADALTEAGVAAKTEPNQKIEERPTVIEIVIGSKPI